MQVEVNYLAVFLAALSSMAVGSLWYAPKVFGNTWAKLVGFDSSKSSKGAWRAMAIVFVGSLITAFILAHAIFLAHKYFGNNYMQDAIMTALWLWLGLTAVRFIVHDVFEGRPLKLTFINISNEFAIRMIMAVIIGFFAPVATVN